MATLINAELTQEQRSKQRKVFVGVLVAAVIGLGVYVANTEQANTPAPVVAKVKATPTKIQRTTEGAAQCAGVFATSAEVLVKSNQLDAATTSLTLATVFGQVAVNGMGAERAKQVESAQIARNQTVSPTVFKAQLQDCIIWSNSVIK